MEVALSPEEMIKYLAWRWDESRRWFDLDEYCLQCYCSGRVFYAVKLIQDNESDDPPYLDVFENHRDAVNLMYSAETPKEKYKIVDVVINPRPADHRIANRFMPWGGVNRKHEIEYRYYSESGIRGRHEIRLSDALDMLEDYGEGYIYICESDEVVGILPYRWLDSYR